MEGWRSTGEPRPRVVKQAPQALRHLSLALGSGRGDTAAMFYPANTWSMPFMKFQGKTGKANQLFHNVLLGKHMRLALYASSFALSTRRPIAVPGAMEAGEVRGISSIEYQLHNAPPGFP